MTLFQALLIALFGYLSSNYSPWCFGQLGGWYTMGRPLVSGLIIGIILGDVRTGILMGAAVQTLYIGLVTPGLSMPADLNFAAYMGIPLAMAAGASTEYALSLSVPLSFLGVSLVYVVASVNVYWVRKQEQWIEQGKIKKAANAPVYASISQFIARFVPIFLACYFGQDFIISVVEAIPAWLGDTVCDLRQDAAGGRLCDAAAVCAEQECGTGVLLRRLYHDRRAEMPVGGRDNDRLFPGLSGYPLHGEENERTGGGSR